MSSNIIWLSAVSVTARMVRNGVNWYFCRMWWSHSQICLSTQSPVPNDSLSGQRGPWSCYANVHKKGLYAICGQLRPKSACAFALADQSSLPAYRYVEQRMSWPDCTGVHADLDLFSYSISVLCPRCALHGIRACFLRCTSIVFDHLLSRHYLIAIVWRIMSCCEENRAIKLTLL